MKRSREPEELREPDARDAPRDSSPDAESRHAKTPAIDEESDSNGDGDGDGGGKEKFAMRCSLPPHKEALGFRSYADYEAHYHRDHTNRCLECRKNLPTEHLLGIHIEECHDPLARVARERGERTYSCFVEGCDRKCSTPQKRRMHLIDKHSYPKNFFFAVTKQGVDGRRSLLHEGGGGYRKKSASGAALQAKGSNKGRADAQEPKASAEQDERTRPEPSTTGGAGASGDTMGEEPKKEEPEKEEETQKDVEMAELTGAMSALQFVPQSIRFGRGRAGFSRR